MNKESEEVNEVVYEPIPDNVVLSDEAQRMYDEMDATFDDDSLIDQIKPTK